MGFNSGFKGLNSSVVEGDHLIIRQFSNP